MTGVTPTSSAQAEAWAERRLPPVERIRDRVWAIPVPVRIPVRYTYAYLVRTAEATILIDPGERSSAATHHLSRGFDAAGVAFDELDGIIVTHYHFDHWEGADDLAALTGAWLALPRAEWQWASACSTQDFALAEGRARLVRQGAPNDVADRLARLEDYAWVASHRTPDLLLADNDTVPGADAIRVMHSPGHSPGHICLLDEENGLFFSGDHVLPGITPHIALNPFGGSDPVGEYLASLRAAEEYDAYEVAPAHEYRFLGLAARAQQIRADVLARCDEITAVAGSLETPTAWEIAQRLTWSKPWGHFSDATRRMALTETTAHLAHIRR